MARTIIAIIVMVLGFGKGFSQNLVPNYNFDKINGNCNPNSYNVQPEALKNWFGLSKYAHLPVNSTESFWLIHECKNGIGNWPWNSQYPGFKWWVRDWFLCDSFDFIYRPNSISGNGYVGMGVLDTFYTKFDYNFTLEDCSKSKITYEDSISGVGNGYIQTKLNKPLVQGQKYVFIFHIHPMLPYRVENHLISHLGYNLSQDTFKASHIYKASFAPSFETNRFFKKRKWYHITNEFIAKGNEEFLTFGNFRNSENANYIQKSCDPNCSGFAVEKPYWPPIIYFDAVYLFKPKDSLFNAYMDSPLYICPGENVTLTVRDTGFKLSQATKNYAWNTGDSSRRIVVDSPGVYTAKVIYDNRWWDTARVVVKEYKPYRSGLPDTVQGCLERQTVVKANPPRDYHSLRWSNSSGSANLPVKNEGTYWLTAKWPCNEVTDTTFVALDSCGTVYKEPEFYVPDAFTPNGDGLNDTWDIYKLPEKNEVWVFNRWGERVFHAKNYRGNWDGTDTQGNKLPPGVYAYRIQYTYPPNITDEKKGSLTIMRRKR